MVIGAPGFYGFYRRYFQNSGFSKSLFGFKYPVVFSINDHFASISLISLVFSFISTAGGRDNFLGDWESLYLKILASVIAGGVSAFSVSAYSYFFVYLHLRNFALVADFLNE